MIMDTNLKNAISAMREKIAELEKNQKNIKPQRKTVHYKGERTMKPWDAWFTALNNKYDLRLMYAAYNLLRGKGFDITESQSKPLIYDPEKYWAYPHGCKGQCYTRDSWLEGKHPLCQYLSEINGILSSYGYEFKNRKTVKDSWGTYEIISVDNYEEIVCTGE